MAWHAVRAAAHLEPANAATTLNAERTTFGIQVGCGELSRSEGGGLVLDEPSTCTESVMTIS